jgi:hypothetical protein
LVLQRQIAERHDDALAWHGAAGHRAGARQTAVVARLDERPAAEEVHGVAALEYDLTFARRQRARAQRAAVAGGG